MNKELIEALELLEKEKIPLREKPAEQLRLFSSCPVQRNIHITAFAALSSVAD